MSPLHSLLFSSSAEGMQSKNSPSVRPGSPPERKEKRAPFYWVVSVVIPGASPSHPACSSKSPFSSPLGQPVCHHFTTPPTSSLKDHAVPRSSVIARCPVARNSAGILRESTMHGCAWTVSPVSLGGACLCPRRRSRSKTGSWSSAVYSLTS
ncbi:hypothetical protein IF1G_03153 [Cordyceps javanica]|uniref:Uncharacterized protein n=1 Tax=Cordyceps javanica TaxID=43265 RepID=A0A545V6R5_9HYPO|nr:hypothetical protein IF1G_03153 [Cordyceps javanica]